MRWKKIITTVVISLMISILTLHINGLMIMARATEPDYHYKNFTNIDKMLAWIRTADEDSLVEDQFIIGISALRELNQVVIPYYPDTKVILSYVIVAPDPDRINGATHFGYLYIAEEQRCSISVEAINPLYQVGQELSEYLMLEYEGRNHKKYQVQPDLLRLHNGREVEYAIFDGGDERLVFFLYDGFEVVVRRELEYWDDNYLTELNFDTVIIRNKGDVTGDGKIDLQDVQKALKAYLNLTTLSERESWAADLYDKGEITLNEVRGILRITLGL